jgi:hypothetical protein
VGSGIGGGPRTTAIAIRTGVVSVWRLNRPCDRRASGLRAGSRTGPAQSSRRSGDTSIGSLRCELQPRLYVVSAEADMATDFVDTATPVRPRVDPSHWHPEPLDDLVDRQSRSAGPHPNPAVLVRWVLCVYPWRRTYDGPIIG